MRKSLWLCDGTFFIIWQVDRLVLAADSIHTLHSELYWLCACVWVSVCSQESQIQSLIPVCLRYQLITANHSQVMYAANIYRCNISRLWAHWSEQSVAVKKQGKHKEGNENKEKTGQHLTATALIIATHIYLKPLWAPAFISEFSAAKFSTLLSCTCDISQSSSQIFLLFLLCSHA